MDSSRGSYRFVYLSYIYININLNSISEIGETLLQAGLRELEEETGLTIGDNQSSNDKILGLWESVYPPILGNDLPKRHHIVVYMHIKSTDCQEELDSKLKVEFLSIIVHDYKFIF